MVTTFPGSMERRRRARRRSWTVKAAAVLGVVILAASVALVAAAALDQLRDDLELNFGPGIGGTSALAGFPPEVMGRPALWSTPVDSPFSSAPAVAAGRVFARDRAGHLHAHDARTGAPLWSAALGVSPMPIADFPPVVVDDVVYVTGWDRSVHALDAATGASRWSMPVAGAAGGFPLTVTADAVYVDADELTALDRSSGARRWSAPVGNESLNGYSQPVVVGELVIVGGGDGRVHALDRSTGAPRWTTSVAQPAGFGSGPTLAAAGELVYVSSPDSQLSVLGAPTAPGHLRALDAGTGAERWSQAIEGVNVFGSSPTVSGATVYVPGRELHAFDASTGARRWSAPSGGSTFFSFTPLTITDGVVFLPGGDGQLQAIDAVSGVPRWRAGAVPPPAAQHADPGPPIPVPPAVLDGVLYLASGDVHLYAYPG